VADNVTYENALRPRVALTIGDPAGVGPEIIVNAWSHPVVHQLCRPLVIGPPEFLRRAAALCHAPVTIQEIAQPEDAEPTTTVIPCLSVGREDLLHVRVREVDARGGEVAYLALKLATELALADRVHAIVTAPLCKEALHAAGHIYPGHTEMLGEFCGVPEVAMMLYLAQDELVRGPAGLGVAHVTLHMALREVFAHLDVASIVATARMCEEVMGRIKGSRPRLGLCALNPHAGEHGLFGDEEQRILTPALHAARGLGLDLAGPFSADTLFAAAAREGRFDGIVAMYHDQGHIALKLLGFHRAVNITLGLPVVRTSVAHGTAFDLAWQGRADHGSLLEALRVAALLVHRRTHPAPMSSTAPATGERVTTSNP